MRVRICVRERMYVCARMCARMRASASARVSQHACVVRVWVRTRVRLWARVRVDVRACMYMITIILYWNGQLGWTPALGLYL